MNQLDKVTGVWHDASRSLGEAYEACDAAGLFVESRMRGTEVTRQILDRSGWRAARERLVLAHAAELDARRAIALEKNR